MTDLVQATAALQRPLDLNINRLTAPFLDPSDGPQAHDPRTPSILAADLKAQKDLFSRLRFAYTKQVEKERTLDYLVNQHVPQLVSDTELADLERETAAQKSALKDRKGQVAQSLAELEQLARSVSQRHEALRANVEYLASHPQRVAALETRAQEAEAALPKDTSADPELNLSLAETEALLAAREQELQTLDTEISRLQNTVLPTQHAEVEGLESEVTRLQEEETRAVEEVKGMRRDRSNGGGGDGAGEDSLAIQARWLRAKDSVLRSMLDA